MEAYPPTNEAYSAMGNGRSDYDAFYGLSDELYHFSWHCHDFYEFYMHLQGAQFYSVDNQTYELKPNQLLIIPPFHMHGLMAHNALKHYERAFIYISQGFLKVLGCGQIDMEQMLSDLEAGNRFVFNMDADIARSCARRIEEVHKSIRNQRPWDRFTHITQLLPVLRMMLETASSGSDCAPATQPDPLMQRILAYIELNCAEEMSIKLLAERFNISPSSLSHRFLRYTHHSVYEYILYKRVMMAKQLLIQNEPPGEVAFRCGFGDYSNFLRAFERISGVSPSRYRRDVHAGQLME